MQYTLVRRKGQKTIRLRFRDDGELVLSCPYSTDMATIRSFLESRKDWIEQKKDSFAKHTFQDGDHLVFLGHDYVLRTQKSPVKQVLLTQDTMLVLTQHPDNEKTVRDLVYRFYCGTLVSFARENAGKWAERLQVDIPDFDTDNSKSRWACCYRNRKLIRFSAMCAVLPQDVLESVLVHEMCHLVYPGHQKDFHSLLSAMVPDIREKERYLKNDLSHRALFV